MRLVVHTNHPQTKIGTCGRTLSRDHYCTTEPTAWHQHQVNFIAAQRWQAAGRKAKLIINVLLAFCSARHSARIARRRGAVQLQRPAKSRYVAQLRGITVCSRVGEREAINGDKDPANCLSGQSCLLVARGQTSTKNRSNSSRGAQEHATGRESTSEASTMVRKSTISGNRSGSMKCSKAVQNSSVVKGGTKVNQVGCRKRVGL